MMQFRPQYQGDFQNAQLLSVYLENSTNNFYIDFHIFFLYSCNFLQFFSNIFHKYFCQFYLQISNKPNENYSNFLSYNWCILLLFTSFLQI